MTESNPTKKMSNVQKNIFKLAEQDGLENQFTAAWGYVLDREPVLAQAVADILLKDRGLTAKVLQVTDHPNCGSLKQPDFHIECEGLDILVEHKLDAWLHESQLENYLGLDFPGAYLALIAPAFQPVPKDVLSHPFYLKPKSKDHFKWSDFHDAVKSIPGRLTQEFADYMTSLGMAPFTLRGTEDIFDRNVRPDQFDDALGLAAEVVFTRDNPGCWLKRTPSGLGREVRTPLPSLSLIYICAEQRSTCIPDCAGPILAVRVFELAAEGSPPLGNEKVTTLSGLDVHRHHLASPQRLGEATCRITYCSPLAEIIQDTKEATVRCMEEVLRVVHEDYWPANLG